MPAALLRGSGDYGRAILTEEEWSCVLAWLSSPLDGLTPEKAAAFKAVVMRREHDMLDQGHPNAREDAFARPSALEELEPEERAEIIVTAEHARDEWRMSGGIMTAARIVGAHKFALACLARDARESEAA